jgi:hypothetical protein
MSEWPEGYQVRPFYGIGAENVALVGRYLVVLFTDT